MKIRTGRKHRRIKFTSVVEMSKHTRDSDRSGVVVRCHKYCKKKQWKKIEEENEYKKKK